MPPHHDIVVIGTGFSGLGVARQLRRAGFRDLVLLERAGDVGGVWRDNTYPGCACDVESPLYSFSFAPHPGWTRLFAGSAEIHQYLRDCADRFGLRPLIRFHTAVTAAAWDDAARHWRIETSAGPLTARVLISGLGALSVPAIPNLPGIERFRGKAFHSAAWDHTLDLAGRDVAVVGTGASAVQLIPAIQPKVGRLTVYQRTPPWVVPRGDRPISEREKKWCERLPVLLTLWRLRLFLTRELFGTAFRYPRLMRKARAAALMHMHAVVKDPELRAKLTPSYEIGCKRVLVSSDYYPALVRPNVEVVTDRIAEVRERSVVTADGTERPADTLVYGTGFHVTDNPAYALLTGRGGRRLSDEMAGSPKAHLGTTVAGFPNLFVLQGPNTGLGHSSVLLMIEHQFAHVLAALRYMRRHRLTAIEPTQEAQDRFVADVDRRMDGTVWTSGGCKSWYLDRTGRNSSIWPGSIPSFGRRVGRFRPGEYHVEAGACRSG